MQVKRLLRKLKSEIVVSLFYWEHFNFCYIGTLKLENV
jgi:hypothetical protein